MRPIIFLTGLLASLYLHAQTGESLSVKGLRLQVEVLRDSNGVNHIYAQNEHDLFFAQGYCAARDRLFQFEIWRRQATGTMAEILGERELKRDIGARLFRFRGDLRAELNHYHPRGEFIIRAFTDGVNAWIAQALQDSSLLPVEFSLLGIRPGMWTPDVVVSRHQGLLNNVTRELGFGRAVAAIGPEKVSNLVSFEPGEPDISLDPLITQELLSRDLLAPYEAFRKPLTFLTEDIRISEANFDKPDAQIRTAAAQQETADMLSRDYKSIGSNNWVVSGKKSASGMPLLANDPHRLLSSPSLRYIVHLNAPGWNVTGGGEPVLPGVSIGHNETGAWGLTIFEIDAEDLMVYELEPKRPTHYRYQGKWEKMKIVRDTIRVKGKPDVITDHLFTRHGPVTFLDSSIHRACAVRAAWLEKGNAPYLASLRMDQARNWKEFRVACASSFLPGENMIWADRSGNIGWQAVGIAPVRKNWSGLVPIPGDGRFEWSGFLPVKQLPHHVNPEKGFLATANENNVPSAYKQRNAVGWAWAEPFRSMRIHEVLNARTDMDLRDMTRLQFDYLSIPARELVPLLHHITPNDPSSEQARQRLLSWDFRMNPESAAAGIYQAWERELSSGLRDLLVPEAGKQWITSIGLGRLIKSLQSPENFPGDRNRFLADALVRACKKLTEKFGSDQGKWIYGQSEYHHVKIRHVLSPVVSEEMRQRLDHGPLPRGGNSHTPGMTNSSDNQVSGASFRMAVDLADWDTCLFTNTPGQSGDPASPFYNNLFLPWAKDRHFNVPFSRTRVERITVHKMLLQPVNP